MPTAKELVEEINAEPAATVPYTGPPPVAATPAPVEGPPTVGGETPAGEYTPGQIDFFGSNRTIGMKAPDGRVYLVPGTGFQAARLAGWEPVSEEEEDHARKVQDIVQERENAPLGAAGTQFLAKAAEHLTGGATAAVLDKVLTPEEKEAEEVLKERSPWASGLGSVTGFAGNLATMGGTVSGLGKVAEGGVLASRLATADTLPGIAADAIKNTLRDRMVASVTRGAVEGGAFGLPQASTELALGDKQKAAETFFSSMGAGMVLAPAFQGSKEAMSGARGVLEGLTSKGVREAPEWYRANAEEYQQHGITPQAAAELGEAGTRDVVESAKKEGIAPADLQSKLEIILSGAKTNKDTLMESLDSDITNHVPDTANGELPLAGVRASDIIENFTNKIEESHPGIKMNSPEYAGDIKVFNNMKDTMKQYGNDPSFKELNEMRKIISAKIGSTDSMDNLIRKSALQTVEQMEEDHANKLFSTNKEAADRFDQYVRENARIKAINDYQASLEQQAAETPKPGTDDKENIYTRGMKWLVGKGVKAGVRAVGAATGGPLGAILLPEVVDAGKGIIKKIGQSVLDVSLGTAKQSLRDDSPYFGVNIIKATGEAFDKAIDKIPQSLSTGLGVSPFAAINPIKNFLGDQSTGLSNDQQFTRTSDIINNAAANPHLVNQEVSKLISVLGETPEMAHAVAMQTYHALQFLHDALPKDPNGPQPFGGREWKATSQEKQTFAQQLGIVENPIVAIQKLSNGTITTAETQALQSVYPKMYEAMASKIVQAGYAPNAPKLTYAQKRKIADFVGEPMTPSMHPHNMTRIQSIAFGPVPSSSEGQQGGAGSHGGSRSALKGPNLYSDMQQLDNKRQA